MIMKMSEKINVFFFQKLSTLVTAPLSEFISENAESLSALLAVRFDFKLNPLLESYESETIAELVSASCRIELERVFQTLTEEYNPAYNSKVTETKTQSGKDTTTDSGTDNTEYGGTDSMSHTGTDVRTDSGNYNDSTVNTVTTYDGRTSQPTSSSTTNGTNGATNSTDYGRTETQSYGKTKEITTSGERIVDYTHSETLTREGSNGLIATQDLLDKEIKLRMENVFTTYLFTQINNVVGAGVFDD